jgi:hypothetical protein
MLKTTVTIDASAGIQLVGRPRASVHRARAPTYALSIASGVSPIAG